jgi:iron complex outermembrane receptor protein
MLIPGLGMIYKPSADYSIYGSYAKGFEINSPDIFAQNYLEFASPPATISDQVEFGVKTSLGLNRIGLTLALFQINKRKPYGYVYLDPENPNYDEYNVYYDGHHRSRGVELEMDGRVTSFLSVNGGLALTATKVMYDPGYPTGNLLPNAPKFSFNGWVNYEHPEFLKGLTAGTGLFYTGKLYPGIDNNVDLQIQPGYTWDAALGYNRDKLGLQLNVMNITNQVSYLNPWQFNLFDVKPLRQFVITLRYRFSEQ